LQHVWESDELHHTLSEGGGGESGALCSAGNHTASHAEKKFPFEKQSNLANSRGGIKAKAGVQTGVQIEFQK
jgi:hypothetical protein